MHTTVYVKMVSKSNPHKSTLLKLEGLAAEDVGDWMIVETYSVYIKGEMYQAQNLILSGSKA